MVENNKMKTSSLLQFKEIYQKILMEGKWHIICQNILCHSVDYLEQMKSTISHYSCLLKKITLTHKHTQKNP